MKKSLLSLLLTSSIAVLIQAENTPICAPSDIVLTQLNDKRFEQIDMSSTTTAKVYFDTKTIKVDKKNKTVDIWIYNVTNTVGRESMIKTYGDAYQNFGLTKIRNRFFYTNNQMTSLALIEHDCDGSTIFQDLNLKSKVFDVVPNSFGEAQLQHIIQKYNLK